MTDELSHWNGPQQGILVACLRPAVHLRVLELAELSDHVRPRVIRKWSIDSADVLPYGGDRIFVRTRDYPDEPGTGRVFNHVAKAIAALAYRPGGVEFAALIWCARHHPQGHAPTARFGRFLCDLCKRDERKRGPMPPALVTCIPTGGVL